MNAEHILDAVGLLPDDLIREAEEYRRPRRSYSGWIGLAASFAVILALGYGVFQLRDLGMGGGAAENMQQSGGAAPEDQMGGIGTRPGTTTNAPSGGAEAPGASEDAEPGSGVEADLVPGPEPNLYTGDRLPALRAEGTVYWATEQYLQLEPEEGEVRYIISVTDSGEPEEDGRASFLPVGTAYVLLDNGAAAVLQEDTGSWQVYDRVPPWER